MNSNINSIAVLGAGTMGAGIAALAADKDCKVLLLDINNEAAQKGKDSMISERNPMLSDPTKINNVEIILGAVEDKISLSNAILKTKPDVIIHAAALKHVDTGEITPIQTVKSNIIGSLNIIECSLEHNIPITIGISTDKACLPEQNYQAEPFDHLNSQPHLY